MSQKTAISWCDETWNPTRGCSAVSPGCAHCFAQAVAGSPFTGLSKPGRPYHGLVEIRPNGEPRWTGKVMLDQGKLQEMLRRRPYVVCDVCGVHGKIGQTPHLHIGSENDRGRWRRPRIFVNSMSDLFHEVLTDEQIASVYGVMAACMWADFLILTKRAERLPLWYQSEAAAKVEDGAASSVPLRSWPLPNVWLGVSVEDRDLLDERWEHLAQIPAAVRFLSCEPLLEELNMMRPLHRGRCRMVGAAPEHFRCGLPEDHSPHPHSVLTPSGVHWFGEGRPVDWVIVGGESGPGHRPCDPAWITSIVEQCTAAGVPVFVKQDSGPRAGKQGRIPPEIWARKEFPEVRP